MNMSYLDEPDRVKFTGKQGGKCPCTLSMKNHSGCDTCNLIWNLAMHAPVVYARESLMCACYCAWEAMVNS